MSELQRRTGLSYSTVFYAVRGEHRKSASMRPSLKTAMLLARATDGEVTVSEIAAEYASFDDALVAVPPEAA